MVSLDWMDEGSDEGREEGRESKVSSKHKLMMIYSLPPSFPSLDST